VNLTITNRLATHQSSKLAKITSFDDLTGLRNYKKKFQKAAIGNYIRVFWIVLRLC